MDFPIIGTKRFGQFWVAWVDGDRWRSSVTGRTEREAIQALIGTRV